MNKTKRDFKTDFEAWYCKHDGIIKKFGMGIVLYSEFVQLPKSMQWGVKVDFFDSVGIEIEVVIIPSSTANYFYRIRHNEKRTTNTRDFKTRQESRDKALEKAIEIYEQLEPKPINLD